MQYLSVRTFSLFAWLPPGQSKEGQAKGGLFEHARRTARRNGNDPVSHAYSFKTIFRVFKPFIKPIFRVFEFGLLWPLLYKSH